MTARVVLAVAVRPGLWGTALRQAWRLGRGGAWRHPAGDPWLRFRMETAYGDPDRTPDPPDVIAWLRWCKGFGR